MIVVIVLSFFFALFYALHDIPAIDCFTKYGSSTPQQEQFHGNSWKAKLCFAIAVSLFADWWLDYILFFIGSGLTIWLVFDPIVARYRESKKIWYYLSEGNQVDRFLLKLFGKTAGIYKTAICIVLITILIFVQ